MLEEDIRRRELEAKAYETYQENMQSTLQFNPVLAKILPNLPCQILPILDTIPMYTDTSNHYGSNL